MQRLWYKFVRWFMRNVYFGTHGGFRAVGAENIPATGGAIIAPVHLSYLDPSAAAVGMKRHLRFMAKEELFRGILGWIISSVGGFPVRRGESDTEAIRKAISVLENGEALLLFPEGTRGDGTQILPVQRGVTMLAKRTNAWVVPVGIVGTHIVMPRGGKGRRHLTTTAYGKAFRYSDIATGASEKENREIFARELEARILELCHAHGLPLKTSSSVEGSPASATLGTGSGTPG
ncbi:MAG: lysophospholipid acyltransferase family protein [Fimbriimonas sp.]